MPVSSQNDARRWVNQQARNHDLALYWSQFGVVGYRPLIAFTPLALGLGLGLGLAAALAAAPIACEATWRDAARARDLPVRITLPGGGERLAERIPVVVWSPGLGGDVRSGNVWASAWANAGLAVVQLAHPGSDAAVYRRGDTPEQRRARVTAGTTPEQIEARVGDVRFALSELARRPATGVCDLRRIDPGRAAIAGHSMGAWVAQGIAGQRFVADGQGFGPAGQRVGPAGQDAGSPDVPFLRDLRFRAAIAFSTTATPGTTAFRRIGIPFLVITGSLDGTTAAAPAAERAAALAARAAAFESMPADGRKCLLVIGGGSHMMFAGNRPGVEPVARHVDALGIAATTAFLTTALKPDRPARIGTDARVAVAQGDVYRCK